MSPLSLPLSLSSPQIPIPKHTNHAQTNAQLD